MRLGLELPWSLCPYRPKGLGLGLLPLNESVLSVAPATFEASLGTSCLLDSGPPNQRNIYLTEIRCF